MFLICFKDLKVCVYIYMYIVIVEINVFYNNLLWEKFFYFIKCYFFSVFIDRKNISIRIVISIKMF